jgi:hypothetical protein
MGVSRWRLNAWQRLFMVVNVIWLLIATYTSWFSQVQTNYRFAASMQKLCESAYNQSPSTQPLQPCFTDYSKSMAQYGSERWALLGATFLMVIIATALFWLAVWLCYLIARWILAGRSAHNSN